MVGFLGSLKHGLLGHFKIWRAIVTPETVKKFWRFKENAVLHDSDKSPIYSDRAWIGSSTFLRSLVLAQVEITPFQNHDSSA
jgi:hypothetical protein